jgi:transcription antitermination factor NusG
MSEAGGSKGLMGGPLLHEEPAAAFGTPTEPRWFACYTRARHEKRVASMFEQHGIESFLPLVHRESQWKDRKKIVGFPLFPSYVFGRFTLGDMHRILSVPGVSTIVRMDGQPIPIRDEDIENVRRFADGLTRTDSPVESVPFIAEGERVEVLEGAFAGVVGYVVERRTRRRVLVGIEAIGQGLEIDVDTRLLRRLDREAS